MITLTLTGYSSGAVLYVYFVDKSLSEWMTHRVLMVEGTGADAGRYTASIDPSVGTLLVVFDATGQTGGWVPTWADVMPSVEFDVASEVALESLAIDIGGVPRVGGGDFKFTNVDNPFKTAKVKITRP